VALYKCLFVLYRIALYSTVLLLLYCKYHSQRQHIPPRSLERQVPPPSNVDKARWSAIGEKFLDQNPKSDNPQNITNKFFFVPRPIGQKNFTRIHWQSQGSNPAMSHHSVRQSGHKISKIGASRCQILRPKCTKFDFRWGSAPDPAGGANSAPPDTLVAFKGPTPKGTEGNRGGEWGKEEEGKGRGG